MPQNLEIKAPLAGIHAAGDIARRLGAEYNGILEQTDTYFNVPHGRLKLREIAGRQNELIAYERDEESSQRQSTYHIYRTETPEQLKLLLEKALGVIAVVRKKRNLYLLGGTRIHLDEVEGLGAFIEFEVPVAASLEDAQQTLSSLIAAFKLEESMFVKNSYVDLMVNHLPRLK